MHPSPSEAPRDPARSPSTIVWPVVCPTVRSPQLPGLGGPSRPRGDAPATGPLPCPRGLPTSPPGPPASRGCSVPPKSPKALWLGLETGQEGHAPPSPRQGKSAPQHPGLGNPSVSQGPRSRSGPGSAKAGPQVPVVQRQARGKLAPLSPGLQPSRCWAPHSCLPGLSSAGLALAE